MGLYLNDNGNLSPIAGRGKAEYGASTVRTGTFKNPEVQANSYATKTITFDTPMPDSNYELSFEKVSTSLCYIEVVSKAAASFVVRFVRPFTGGTPLAANDSTWNYTAFKLYTDNEYNGLLNNQRYSTDEINTGKTWIDGKPIYRKVLTGTFSNGTEVSIASLNIQTIVSASGHTTFTNGYSSPFPYCTSSGVLADFRITPLNSSPKILFDLNESWSNNTYFIILEYTKTT